MTVYAGFHWKFHTLHKLHEENIKIAIVSYMKNRHQNISNRPCIEQH